MRKYTIQSLTILLFTLVFSFGANAQFELKGKVLSKDGAPVEHVNVELVEAKKSTVTDAGGQFTLKNITAGNYTLVTSFAGMRTQSQKVDVSQNKDLSVQLYIDETELQEIFIESRKSINNQQVDVGKLSADPMDIPQSITVINKNLITDQQSQKLSDVIRNVNGVYLATTRAGTNETFYARGYNFSSGNMFKNGSRINTGSFPEMSSLEKVEVLKGSAAILYGNVAPGGIINMVTKQPKFNFGGEASLRVAEYGLVKPTVDVYGPISNKVAFRVNGTYEQSDSYRDQVSSKKYYFNPSFLFKLGAKTELLVQGDYLDQRFTPDFGTGSLGDTLLAVVPRSRFMGTGWQYNDVQQGTATANVKHTFNSNWKLSATVNYQNFQRDYYSVERIQGKTDGTWARPLGRINTEEDYYAATIDLNGKFFTGKVQHNLLAGTDADRYFTINHGFDVAGKIYDTINLLNPNMYVQRTDIPEATALTQTRAPINRVGFYVQDLIHLSDKFKLLAGVRYSSQNNKAITTNYLAKDSTGLGEGKTTDAFSPRLGLVYRPKENISAFASYSNSFSINTGLDVNGDVLPPSIIDQYEIGIKNELFNGKLSANLTLYKIINNNLAQTAPFLPDGTPNNNNQIKELAGQTTSNGFEVDLQSAPIAGLNVMAGFSHNDMRYTKTEEAKGNYIEGDRLVNTPANTANASAFYTVQKGRLTGLKFGVSGLYVGDRFAGWNNTQGQNQQFSRSIFIKGFTTVDVTAGYAFRNWSLLAKLANVGNVYNYYVHENYSINPIPPRMITTTLAYKF